MEIGPRCLFKLFTVGAILIFLSIKLQLHSLRNPIFPSGSSSSSDPKHHTEHSIQQVIPLARHYDNTNTSNGSRQANHPPLSTQIRAILHYPTEGKIVVQFKSGTNCTNPKLFGRLSGKFLSVIRWDRKNILETASDAPAITMQNSNDTILRRTDTQQSIDVIGYYNVPSPGRYFIEIIGLLCNDYTYNQDIQNICLEDPVTHRITDISAYIDVLPENDGNITMHETSDVSNGLLTTGSSSRFSGFWKWSRSRETPVPLQTRYQPIGCRDENISLPRCIPPMSFNRFDPYTFDSDLTNRSLSPCAGRCYICMVGRSHTRVMLQDMKIWIAKWNLTSRVIIKYTETAFPNEWQNHAFQVKTKFCHKILVAVGQWPAGRGPHVVNFPDFYNETKSMIKFLQGTGGDIYLRSIHYNPMGDVKIVCPPKDWRSPPTIDGYNDIYRSLSVEMNVSYIDTSFIVAPLWDSAVDWCHYQGKVSRTESFYVLKQMGL